MPSGFNTELNVNYSGAANTIPASGTAPQVASAGRGITGMTDRGNPSTGACCYSINSGLASNADNVSFPGIGAFEFPRNCADYAGTPVTLGYVFVQSDGDLGGPVFRTASGRTIGFMAQGTGGYLRGKQANETTSSSIVDYAPTLPVSVVAGMILGLQLTQISSTVLGAVMTVWSAGTDPTASDPGTPLYSHTESVTVTGMDFFGPCTAGFASFNSARFRKFWLFSPSTVLTAAAPTAGDRGDKCITINVQPASGGEASKTYTLERATVTNNSVGAYSDLATGLSPGAYDDTAVTPGTTYSYKVTVDDGTTTETSTAIQIRALALNELKLLVIGDSNYQIPPYGSGVTKTQSMQVIYDINRTLVDCVVKGFAVAGTVVADWLPGTGSQSSQLTALKNWANKYCSGRVDILIGIGTNDAATGTSTTKANYKSRLLSIIAWLKANITAAATTVVLCTPAYIPASGITNHDSSSPTRIASYIDAIGEIADVTSQVVFADDPRNGDSWNEDGAAAPSLYGLNADLHPNQTGQTLQGYRLMRYFAPRYVTSSSGGSGSSSAIGEGYMEVEATTINDDVSSSWSDETQFLDGPVTVDLQPLKGGLFYQVGTDVPSSDALGKFVKNEESKIVQVPSGKTLFYRSKDGTGTIAYDLKNN